MHNNSLSFQSPKLSGIGRQLDQLDNSNDPDRACKVNPIKKYYISKYFYLHFQFYFTYIGILPRLNITSKVFLKKIQLYYIIFQNIFLYIFNFILLIYRYYVVSSKDGFLPPGTPCAKNSKFKKKSFCVMGKCLEFGNDMTPKQVLSNETLSDIRGMVINKPRSLRLKRELFIEPPKLGKYRKL